MSTGTIHNSLLRDYRMLWPTDSIEIDQITDIQTNMIPINAIGGNATHETFWVGDTFKDYFNGRPGELAKNTYNPDKWRLLSCFVNKN